VNGSKGFLLQDVSGKQDVFFADVAGVNRSIERLKRAVSKPHGRGRLYGITILLTPLDHRHRESKPSTKSPKANKKGGQKK